MITTIAITSVVDCESRRIFSAFKKSSISSVSKTNGYQTTGGKILKLKFHWICIQCRLDISKYSTYPSQGNASWAQSSSVQDLLAFLGCLKYENREVNQFYHPPQFADPLWTDIPVWPRFRWLRTQCPWCWQICLVNTWVELKQINKRNFIEPQLMLSQVENADDSVQTELFHNY